MLDVVGVEDVIEMIDGIGTAGTIGRVTTLQQQTVQPSQIDWQTLVGGLTVIAMTGAMFGMVKTMGNFEHYGRKGPIIKYQEPPVEAETIGALARLNVNRYQIIPGDDEEHRHHKPAPYRSTVGVMNYTIVVEGRYEGGNKEMNYTLKLYENMPNFGRKLRATQTAFSRTEIDQLKQRVIDAVFEARGKNLEEKKELIDRSRKQLGGGK